MAKTCPSCGYHPIGPYIDNCPICAEPVRELGGGPSGSAGGTGTPPLLIAGWIGVALVVLYLFAGDWPWVVLNAAVCGAAWWLIARAETSAGVGSGTGPSAAPGWSSTTAWPTVTVSAECSMA